MNTKKYNKVAKSTSTWLIILGSWFFLSFIGGIEYLVDPWRIEHGVWFWLSLSLIVQVIAAAWVCWAKLRWSHFFVLPLTGTWLVIQFFAHWLGFIRPPLNNEIIDSYYTHFNTWYLIPQMNDRIVPDGYHTILTILLLVCFSQGLRLLFITLHKRNSGLSAKNKSKMNK